MIVGVPREEHRHEHRVGLNPFGVAGLVRRGHMVLVESRAGESAHFGDDAYRQAGASVVYDVDEIYGRAGLICRVGRPGLDELEALQPQTVVCAFQHLAVAPADLVRRLVELRATTVSYELIRDAAGERPVRVPISEMAGQMAVTTGASLLQRESGGRGVLLGTVPGVPPPTVVVLGAGVAGRSAARTALALGGHVIVLDENVGNLRRLVDAIGPGVVTVIASVRNLTQYTSFADLLIGAVHLPGERAPFVVTEAMVRDMKPGSVIVDLSIDQGGCVETSRPTQLDHPTYVLHDVVHCCVPNLTANVARTATRALVAASLPHVMQLCDLGVAGALREDPGLAEGVLVYEGQVVDEHVSSGLDLPVADLDALIAEGRA